MVIVRVRGVGALDSWPCRRRPYAMPARSERSLGVMVRRRPIRKLVEEVDLAQLSKSFAASNICIPQRFGVRIDLTPGIAIARKGSS